MKNRSEMRTPDLCFNKLPRNFRSASRPRLAVRLLPQRFANHEIEVEKNQPVSLQIYQLSPDEQKAARAYIENLLKKEQTRRNKSPYCASLFFVK